MFHYDDLIVPLLCQMINLEELQLYLSVGRFNGTYIDGVQLHDQFLIHMAQLNKFSFSIKTNVYNQDIGLELQSDEAIQNSFISRHYQRVASYVYTNSAKTRGECRIYSLPFAFDFFIYYNDSFQGGMFHRVRYVKMNSARDSFEYRLFKLMSHDFPFLEFLSISNSFSQKEEKDPTTLIIFPYLMFLGLKYVHDDYAEQFLLKKHAHLPRLLNLRIQYQSLRTITNNFIKDAKQFNFSTLKYLDPCESFVRPENFNEYFPLL